MSITEIRTEINNILETFVNSQNTKMMRVEMHRDSFNIQEVNIWTNIAVFTVNANGPHAIKVVLSTHSPHCFEYFDNNSEAPAKIVHWIGNQPGHETFKTIISQQKRLPFKFNFKLEVIYKGHTNVMGTDIDDAVKTLKAHLESCIPNNYSVNFTEASASATEEAEFRTFRIDDLKRR